MEFNPKYKIIGLPDGWDYKTIDKAIAYDAMATWKAYEWYQSQFPRELRELMLVWEI